MPIARTPLVRLHRTKSAGAPPPAAEPCSPANQAAAPAGAAAPAPGAESHPAELISPARAAGLLGVTAKVLERWRATGGGPAFVRLTSKTIRYRCEDLDAFVAARVRSSTAA